MKNRILILILTFFVSVCLAQTRWPVAPQTQQASVAGTVGEYRETTDGGVVVGYRFHRGVDITNGANYNVYATNTGIAQLHPGSFWKAYIEVGNVSYYHIVFEVEEGQEIHVGDFIGTMRLDGPVHVHYQRDDVNFLNNFFLYPFNDNTVPTISSHSFHVDGVTRTNNTAALNTIRNISGQNYTLIHNKVDLVVNASDTRLNPLGNIGTTGAVAPFQLSYEVYDSENQSVNGEQVCLRYDHVPLQNNAASFVFGPGTTMTNLNWILTSSPFDINPATNGYGRHFNSKIRLGVTENWSGNANLEARYNTEALYRDGLYTMRFRARDVDDDDTFNSTTRNGLVLVDNFRPYVKEVIVKQNDANGALVYRGFWEWNGTRLKFNMTSYPTLTGLQTIWVKVIASEGLNNLTVNLPSVDGSTTYRTMDVVAGTKNTEFTMVYTSAALASGNQFLNFQGSDFNENPLERMHYAIPQSPEINPKIRQNATAWLPAPDPGTDQNHFFNGASSICGGSGGRIAKNGRSTGTCLYVGFDANVRQVAPGGAVTFTNLTAGGNGTLTYQWNFGSGASPATATTAGPHTVSYSGSGPKTVSLTVTDAEGSETNTQTDYITVSPPPASGDFNASPTSGGATLTVNFSAPAASSWSWSFPGGSPSSSTAQNPVVSYSSAGTYDVSLTTDGVSNTKYGLITVTSVPAITASIVDCNNYYFNNCGTSYRDRETIYFAAVVSGGQPFYNYLWNFGDGTTSTQFDPAHLYNSSGTYTVSLTVTDLRGVSTTVSKSISVISIIPSITANFSASDNSIFTGDGPVVFTDQTSSNVDMSNANYYWNFGEGAYPRYAYTKGPHTVCYSNITTWKTVYLSVEDPISGVGDPENKVNFIYVGNSNLNQCPALTPQWVTTPGANVVAAQNNCNITDLVGIDNGNLSTILCSETGINGTFGKCAFKTGEICVGHPFYGSHGDPTIINTSRGKSLRLWTSGKIFQETNGTNHVVITSEGVYYQHHMNFRAGETYRFSFYAATQNTGQFGYSTVDHIKIGLANGLQPAGMCDLNGIFDLPSYPFSYFELGSFRHSTAYEEWRCFVVSFVAPSNDFNQIWVYPFPEESTLPFEYQGGSANRIQQVLMIDDFSLRSYENDCPMDIAINASSPLNTVYRAENTINTSGTYTVNSGQSAQFRSGLSVKLTPGFTASSGSNFQAVIEPCDINTSGRQASTEVVAPTNSIYNRIHFGIDEDLRYLYTKEIQEDDSEELFTVVPNPAREKITVSAAFEKESNVVISLINTLGIEVRSKFIGKVYYVNEEIYLDGLAKGVYLLRLQTEDKMRVKKIVVE